MQSRTTHSLVSLALLTAIACAHQQDPEEIFQDTDNGPDTGGTTTTAGTGAKAGSVSVGSGGAGSTTSKGGSSALPTGKAGSKATGGSGGSSTAGTGAGGTGGGSAGSGSVHVPLEGMAAQFKAQSTDENPVDFLGGELYVINDSIEALPFADLKIRYYITNEVTDVAPMFVYQWANYGNDAKTDSVPCTGTVVPMTTPKAGADTYIEISCTAGANLERGERLTISWKVGAQGMGKMLQTDDWSFAAEKADNEKVVVLNGNTVVWGLEP